MTSTYVVIQFVAACECFRAVFAIINERSIKVDVLDMFPHIASIRTNFSTNCASVNFGTFLHNVFVQLLSVPACKQQESTTIYLTQNIHLVQKILECISVYCVQ